MAKPRACPRLSLEHDELTPEGENLRFERNTGPNRSPERGEDGDEQRGHAARERHQPSARICNDGSRFWILGRAR